MSGTRGARWVNEETLESTGQRSAFCIGGNCCQDGDVCEEDENDDDDCDDVVLRMKGKKEDWQQ